MNFRGFSEAIVLDLETTGLLYDDLDGSRIRDGEGIHRVIEIAALRVNFENIEPAVDAPPHKYYMVNPERGIPEGAFRKNRIRRSDVEGCPLFSDIAQELRDFIGASPIIAHKVDFDERFLSEEFRDAGIAHLGFNRHLCTMRRFEELYPASSSSLDAAAIEMRVQRRSTGVHGAMEDAMITLRIASEFYAIDNDFDQEKMEQNRTHLSRIEDSIRYCYRNSGSVLNDPTSKPSTVPNQSFMDKIRLTYPRAYTPWTDEDEEELKRLHNNGMGIEEMATQLERQPGGIRSRLSLLGLTPNDSS